MNDTYKKLLQSVSYVAVGSFLVYYAALTVYVLNIVVGWVFIAFGFAKAATALMKETPNWIKRVDFPLAIVLFVGAAAFVVAVAVKNVFMIQPVFVAIVIFVVLLLIVQVIDFTRSRKSQLNK